MKNKSPGGRLGNSLPTLAQQGDPEEQGEPTELETEGHMNDLMRAEKIKSDPIKMKAVHKLAGRHQKQIKSIQDLKDVFEEKYGSGKPPKAPGTGTNGDGM